MIAYRVRLADYLAARKVIADDFFAGAAAAEETCENATHSAIINSEQDAAQDLFKSQFRDVYQEHTESLKALGPPPEMPLGCEPN